MHKIATYVAVHIMLQHYEISLHTLQLIYTPDSSPLTPHCSPFILTNSTLLTPHSTLRTLHPYSSLHTPHLSLHTPHPSLHPSPFTPHFTLLTPHSSLHTTHPLLLTSHYSPLTPHSSQTIRTHMHNLATVFSYQIHPLPIWLRHPISPILTTDPIIGTILHIIIYIYCLNWIT